jgi:hypothetical protein
VSPRIQGGKGPRTTRPTRMIDGGTISPKLIAAVIAAVVGYIVGQEALDLPAWAEVAGQAVLVGIATYAARPGAVVTDTRPRAGVRGGPGTRVHRPEVPSGTPCGCPGRSRGGRA